MKRPFGWVAAICLCGTIAAAFLLWQVFNAESGEIAQQAQKTDAGIQSVQATQPGILQQSAIPLPTPSSFEKSREKNTTSTGTTVASDMAFLSMSQSAITQQELEAVAKTLFTSSDKVFPIQINNQKLSSLTPTTIINLHLPDVGKLDYVIENIDQQNGVNNLSGRIDGDANSIRGIHISWKDNAMFGSIATPYNVLHLTTINNKHFLFIANPEFTD